MEPPCYPYGVRVRRLPPTPPYSGCGCDDQVPPCNPKLVTQDPRAYPPQGPLRPGGRGFARNDCGCDDQIPVCNPKLVPQIPLTVQLEQLILNLFGAVTYTFQNNRFIWNSPCGTMGTVPGFPRMPDEGFICYLLRYFTSNINFNGSRILTGIFLNPNGSIEGNPGDLYINQVGGIGETLWVKEIGTGATGWAAANTQGHFDTSGNPQVYDTINNVWVSVTAPDGILTTS